VDRPVLHSPGSFYKRIPLVAEFKGADEILVLLLGVVPHHDSGFFVVAAWGFDKVFDFFAFFYLFLLHL
jgi:hypothetical protein